MTPTIHIADSDDCRRRCFAVMHELRPHLTLESFLAQVQRQEAQGYRLACVESGGDVMAVAGYRVLETLAWGRLLYVDDLVARESARGAGFGSALIDWLIEEARREGCAQFHLDSGVQRFEAHRFYLHKGMDITCHHFAMLL